MARPRKHHCWFGAWSKSVSLRLVRYRDNQMFEYVWFYADDKGERVSPEFRNDEEREKWLKDNKLFPTPNQSTLMYEI